MSEMLRGGDAPSHSMRHDVDSEQTSYEHARSSCGRSLHAEGRPEFALEFRDVSFSYERGRDGADRDARGDSVPHARPAHLVLEHLSLRIPAGGITGIVGPNGCGKSTLLKLADGLLAPTSGEVRICGQPVAELGARERARLVALLPQVHRTPSMSVRELVMCGRYAHMGVFGRPGAEDWRAVDEALAEVGVEHLAHKPARGLSGGERQRAFLAMAVAQDAHVLMLDEPTTYLDVRAASETMALSRQLSERRGTTVVAVIHDLDLALRSCDSLVVLGDGGDNAVDSDSGVMAQGPSGSPAVIQALGDAFGVDVFQSETPRGPAFSFFPRE